jgi:hypothetical protein
MIAAGPSIGTGRLHAAGLSACPTDSGLVQSLIALDSTRGTNHLGVVTSDDPASISGRFQFQRKQRLDAADPSGVLGVILLVVLILFLMGPL